MEKFQLLVTISKLPDGRQIVAMDSENLDHPATLVASALQQLSNDIRRCTSNIVLNQVNQENSNIAVFDVESAVNEIKLCDIQNQWNQ